MRWHHWNRDWMCSRMSTVVALAVWGGTAGLTASPGPPHLVFGHPSAHYPLVQPSESTPLHWHSGGGGTRSTHDDAAATATATDDGAEPTVASLFDVLVYGATPGGCAAAIAAGREGRRVVLIEPSRYVGGAMSGGLGQADYGMHAARVLGGLSEEFFRRVAVKYDAPFTFPPDRQCGEHKVPWVSEPHIAEAVFVEMLHAANVTVMAGTRVARAQFDPRGNGPPRIGAVVTTDGQSMAATVYIDGTYEGTLMKMVGVSYTFGREASTTYNETTAGRLPGPEVPDWPFGDRAAQLPRGINPYTNATNTTLIDGVWGGHVANPGDADDRVGSYDWRVVLTDVPSNRVAIPEPEHYDPAEFELIRRAITAGWHPSVPAVNVPNRKTDWKMFGTFGEHPNAQWSYPNGTYEEQQAVTAEFKRYAVALLHFFRVDESVPVAVRSKISEFGLCRVRHRLLLEQ
eukprot:m.311002 g.311002  ORF g.311002 m.311002 type:complete len:458 (+) comp27445_c0_seq2:164-1537(+)